MGFMQLDYPIAGYRAMWPRLTQFEGVKATPSLLVIFTQCLDQMWPRLTQFEGVKATPSLLVIFTQCLDQIAA